MNPRGALLAVLAMALLASIGSAHGQCFTEFRVSPGSYPGGITAGPDGNLWFTEFNPGNIARILPLAPNTFTEFNVSPAELAGSLTAAAKSNTASKAPLSRMNWLIARRLDSSYDA